MVACSGSNHPGFSILPAALRIPPLSLSDRGAALFAPQPNASRSMLYTPSGSLIASLISTRASEWFAIHTTAPSADFAALQATFSLLRRIHMLGPSSVAQPSQGGL